MNGFHGTKWRCLHFACACREWDGGPILSVSICVTIDSMQNFDANVGADADANVTCKQDFSSMLNPVSYLCLTSISDQVAVSLHLIAADPTAGPAPDRVPDHRKVLSQGPGRDLEARVSLAN